MVILIGKKQVLKKHKYCRQHVYKFSFFVIPLDASTQSFYEDIEYLFLYYLNTRCETFTEGNYF